MRRSTALAPALAAILATHGALAGDAGSPTPAATRTLPSPPAPKAEGPKPNAQKADAPTEEAPKPAPQPTKPGPKPASKPPAKPSVKVATKPGAKVPPPAAPARPVGVPDPAVRRAVAGGPTLDDVALGAESPELRALREAEKELFPPAAPASGPWPSELPNPSPELGGGPRVHATGVPPAPIPTEPPAAEGGRDLRWLAQLQLPDLPIRWEPRLVRYLELVKDDPRIHAIYGVWLRRSGRYRDLARKVLRQKGLPEDLVWLALVESGFDPLARSPAGAAGLWQFMPETGRQYGLPQDRWVDHRLDVVAATSAAADFLSDLHRRFGSWELAMASYNWGYGGVLAAVRRYNTNDFWTLANLEASMPWETTLYVPKILAVAVVAKNLAAFGYGSLVPDAPVEFEEALVPPGTPLSAVAQAAGVPTKEIEQLNPELRASRVPPSDGAGERTWPVKVPVGKAAAVAQNLPKLGKGEVLERYVVRFGEGLDAIAEARGTTVQRLVELNAIAPGEVVRGGTVLLVPPPRPQATASTPAEKPPVVVPADVFVYPGRKRVFYKVTPGDTLPEIATALKVAVDDLRRWNEIDPAARLVEGMTLQAFVPQEQDMAGVVVLAESDVRPVPVGTEEFFALGDALKGRKRVILAAKEGETLSVIGKRFGVTPASMERINRRPRSDVLRDGESVVVYVPQNSPAPACASCPAPGAEPQTTVEPLPPMRTELEP
jgi:membrane-bound lytic murein transglycosylase D